MIEQMTHVAVIAKSADRNGLLDWLYGEKVFHVMPIDEKSDDWGKRFSSLPDDTQELDAKLNRINSVVSFCQEFVSKKPSFLDAMLPLKTVGTKQEIESAVEEVSIDLLYNKVAEMRSAMEKANEHITRLQAQKTAVEQFSFLGDDLPRLKSIKHTRLEVVAVSGQGGKAFLLDERIVSGKVAAELLFADQTHSYYALAVPQADAEVLRALIDDHGLHVHPIPDVKHGAKQELAQLGTSIADETVVLEAAKADAAKFADAWQRKVNLAAGKWESEKNLAAMRLGMSESSHLFTARGYVKTVDLPAFKQKLEVKAPGATVMECDAPSAEEEPPISMKWNKWISPASLLVKMYGLPSYKGIDPTLYVATIFFLFVGICLGDAVYGIALILIMEWLKRKYKEQEHLQDFFQVFVYCGVVAIVVGCLTGSFMGDVSSMIPGMGWFDKLRTKMAIIDPIKDSQLALYIAIGIGVVTQFYGMILRVYRDWRRGDKMGAFSDGILWIAFLLFVILAAVTGSAFFWALFILSIIGLIMTQGRDQKGLIARTLVGAISLYGIVGAYGASAILGDLISYARLMALSLTSAALGSTFNMLAKMAGGIAGVGVVVAVLIVVGGHLMNFFLGLLGGFVHSARLVMLEFFGRFYEAGGTAYKPYGFNSTTVGEKKQR